MKANRLLILLSLSLSMAACGKYNIQPIETPEGPAATLTVYRPHYHFGANAPVVIALDGVDIALLKNNNYLETPISAGAHVVSVRGFRVGRADEIELTIAENRDVLLKVDVPPSTAVKAAVPLSMHLSKLYYLKEEDPHSVQSIKEKFTRVGVKYKQKQTSDQAQAAQ